MISMLMALMVDSHYAILSYDNSHELSYDISLRQFTLSDTSCDIWREISPDAITISPVSAGWIECCGKLHGCARAYYSHRSDQKLATTCEHGSCADDVTAACSSDKVQTERCKIASSTASSLSVDKGILKETTFRRCYARSDD